MLATEFDMEKALQALRLDVFEQGLEQGIEETERRMALGLLKKGYPDHEIISLLDISAEKLQTFREQQNTWRVTSLPRS